MLYLLALIFGVFYTLPSIILACLQFRYIRFRMEQPPVILSPKDYREAGEYSLAKLKVSIISSVIEFIVFLFWVTIGFWMLGNFLNSLDFSETIRSLCFVLVFLCVGSVISLPIGFYTTMVLDKKFGFSKSTLGLFIKDTIKGFAMLLVIGGIIVFLLLVVMDHFSYWWFAGFVLIFAFAILTNVLYPILIAPIFNKFTPLNDDVLREKIEAMMVKVGFKSSGIFIVDASKRDGRLNAYFGGLGKSKRVVLFDTLLQKVSQEGLLSILGHELGHFKHKDILKNILIVGVLLFIVFFIVGNLPQSIFEAMGVPANPAATITFLLLISPVISFLAMPVMGFFSRKAEYRADEFGASLTSKYSLAEALIRIVNENKAFPCSHPAYIFFYYTHPPLLKRLEALDYHMEK
ncbi:M48 family metallopeptidase [Helicobacter sp. 11S02596-1]|uniref:M48 family metallopeptidase n=1 Tax=Helicobacter sp. 11S02596-1 TaxID=1476194 RepID=UPI000BA65A5A|nr:M48 family metallopeptidase [Helicobacter sp. 11S02596-1]PAF45209.1 peptidase M48 [Helicobacter sp. 11S02596-1]